MKKVLVPWLIVLAKSSEMSKDQACHFIGLKLAKTPSLCDASSGTCTSLSLTRADGLVGSSGYRYISDEADPLKCDDAQSITQNLLLKWNGDYGYTIDATTLRGKLLTLVEEDFYFLLFGHQTLSAEGLARMGEINDFVMGLVKENWKFRADFVHLVGFDTIRAFSDRMSELIYKSIRSPHSVDTHGGLMAPVFHFLLDLAAVYPEHFPLRPEDIRPFAAQVVGHPPQYRDPMPGELLATVDIPKSGSGAVAIMSAFEELARLSHSLSVGRRAQATEDHLTSIEWAMSIADRSNAATQMLSYIIRTRICPFLRETILLFVRSEELLPPLIIKNGISLIQECQPHVQLWPLLQASIDLGRLDAGVADKPRDMIPLHGSLVETLAALADDNYPWINVARLGRMDQYDIQQVLVDVAIPDIFPRYGDTQFRRFPIDASEVSLKIDFPLLLKALGRLIGLTLRASLPVRYVNLHPDVLKTLQNPSRIRACFLHLRDFGDADQYLEVIRIVRQGIIDVLGPAAFQCFATDQSFISRFPHSSNDP